MKAEGMCQQKENINVKEKVTKGGKKGWRKVHLFNVPVNDLAFHTVEWTANDVAASKNTIENKFIKLCLRKTMWARQTNFTK